MITIVDYGVGNIAAFLNVYKRLNLPACAAKTADEIKAATCLILPGVGSFDNAMQRLNASGMREALCEQVEEQGVPVLGVCVGMQMLASGSDEGEEAGLSWIDGTVRSFRSIESSTKLPLPHMGWNDVQPVGENPLFVGLESDGRFYFLHSFYFHSERSEDTAAISHYGVDFSCSVRRENVYGVQFHPEKKPSFRLSAFEKFFGTLTVLRPRITPCLLVHQGGLVKTVQFGEHEYVGDPINAVKIFNEKEADELIVVDIDASVEGRQPDFKLIRHLALECRMPLCYGGGINNPSDAARIVELGVEKVAISSAAVNRPQLIQEIGNEIGGQSVAIVLDVKRKPNGQYCVMTHNGGIDSGTDLVAMAEMAQQMGAGELVVNSIDNDGVMKGYDLELARLVRKTVTIPITLLGGAGKLPDMAALINECGVIGAAAGSMFVFKGPYRSVLINYPSAEKKERIFADIQL